MFDDYFEVFLADTQEGREKHYNIRYQVYCDEMGFEDKNKFPTEQEKDQWDDHSAHFMVRLKHTGQWIGAMRVVFQNEHSLPMQEHCSVNEIINKNNNHSIELSRMCLVKEIRRLNPNGISDESDDIEESDNVKLFFSHKQMNRSVIFGLLRAAAQFSADNNIKKWYFLTAAALAKVLGRKGLQLTRVGDSCNFKGERFPFTMIPEAVSNTLLTQGFQNGYRLYSELETPQIQAASA